MITLHRLNGEEIILNHHHIEIIEQLPDTIITLTNEKKYLVKESADQVIKKIMDYNREVFEKRNG